MLKQPYYSIEHQGGNTNMTYTSIRDHVLRTLEQELPLLTETYGIAEIGIFGSVSRGEDTPDSDIDILYTFRPGKSTLANLSGLHEYLETLFGRNVDLVSKKWMSPILRPYIEQDVIFCGTHAGAA